MERRPGVVSTYLGVMGPFKYSPVVWDSPPCWDRRFTAEVRAGVQTVSVGEEREAGRHVEYRASAGLPTLTPPCSGNVAPHSPPPGLKPLSHSVLSLSRGVLRLARPASRQASRQQYPNSLRTYLRSRERDEGRRCITITMLFLGEG